MQTATEVNAGYVNYGSMTGKSKQRGLKSAITRFNAFLVDLHNRDPIRYPYTDFNAIPEEAFNKFQDVFGCFPDYLKKEGLMMNTANNYMSHVSGEIRSKCRTTDIEGKWYQALRDRTEKQYGIQARATNTRVSNPSAPIFATVVQNSIHTW